MFISSPVGVTIYSAEKYYDAKNNVIDFKWFKK